MDGKSVREAQNKARADKGKPPIPPRTANPQTNAAVKRDANGRAYITLDGADLYLAPTPPAAAPPANAAHLADAANSLLTDECPSGVDPIAELESWLARGTVRVSELGRTYGAQRGNRQLRPLR